jgi:DNA processing protein
VTQRQPVDAPDELAVALSLLRSGPDARKARALKNLTRTPEHAGSQPPDTDLMGRLAEALGLPLADRAAAVAAAHERAARSLELAAHWKIAVVPWYAAEYSALLREIYDPPIVLWCRGDRACLSRPAVAVVGSRRATPAGLSMARTLGRGLTEAGLLVVSGLARGVDGAAHEGALEAGGQTAAVLGCGADVVYPPEHGRLARRIMESGLIATEFPMGMPPLAHHFPLRNRTISGLCRAVVLVEASNRSGSLITARAALEQGRDVLAVPGNVVSGRSTGCHALIKDGASLVETVEDVLHELGWAQPAAPAGRDDDKCLSMSPLEAEMALGEAYDVDELAERTGLSPAGILADLGALEVAGRVTRVPGGGFVKLDKSAIGEGDG